jgi:hypothetical protein
VACVVVGAANQLEVKRESSLVRPRSQPWERQQEQQRKNGSFHVRANWRTHLGRQMASGLFGTFCLLLLVADVAI